MTSQLETEVIAALEEFLAKVTQAAERASIEVVHSVFARVSLHQRGTVAAVAPPQPRTAASTFAPRHRSSAHPSEEHAPARRPRAVTSAADVRASILARIREAPGSTASQLGDALGLRSDTVRRYLRLLLQVGEVRSEARLTGPRGALPRREFFVAQQSETSDLSLSGSQPDPRVFSAEGAA
jgi:hypothetical protein